MTSLLCKRRPMFFFCCSRNFQTVRSSFATAKHLKAIFRSASSSRIKFNIFEFCATAPENISYGRSNSTLSTNLSTITKRHQYLGIRDEFSVTFSCTEVSLLAVVSNVSHVTIISDLTGRNKSSCAI